MIEITRRRAIEVIGGAGALIVATACGSKGSSKAATSSASTTGSASGAATSCTLAPEVTQGPYWLTDHPARSDITGGKPGTPLTLKLTVVNAQCAVIPNARVDIWHCDAGGSYAGVGSSGGGPGGGSGAATRVNSDTYCQGYQTTGTDGAVTFTTVYPGWYRGRAAHIHMKVFVGGSDVHTGQLFFPDDLNATVYKNAPYASNGTTPDTLNGDDSIYKSAGPAALLGPAKSGSGYAASAQLVVKAT